MKSENMPHHYPHVINSSINLNQARPKHRNLGHLIRARERTGRIRHRRNRQPVPKRRPIEREIGRETHNAIFVLRSDQGCVDGDVLLVDIREG